jgi:hypothetical protein
MNNVAYSVLLVSLIISVMWLLIKIFCHCNRGMFDSVTLFDPEPESLGVYNLQEIEPVILRKK